MTYLIAVRATGTDDTVHSGATKSRCRICGEEVYVASSVRKLLQQYDIAIVCLSCLPRVLPGISPRCYRCQPSFRIRKAMTAATTSEQCTRLQRELRNLCHLCQKSTN